jgi:hypothetical protein
VPGLDRNEHSGSRRRLGGDQGIGPRPAPTDYSAWRTAGGMTLAAAVLTPEQVKKRFNTNLNHGYVAVGGGLPGTGQ